MEQAIEEGREAGLPDELLDSLPGMVFEATSAAGAVHIGESTMAQVFGPMGSGFLSSNIAFVRAGSLRALSPWRLRPHTIV